MQCVTRGRAPIVNPLTCYAFSTGHVRIGYFKFICYGEREGGRERGRVSAEFNLAN